MFEETTQIVKEFVYCVLLRSGSGNNGNRMSAPTLYYIQLSPGCRYVLLLSKMLDLELDLRILNIMQGEQMKPEFVEMNPQHCVPTLNDNGLILWER